jgi:hypothetical protein
VPSGQECDDTNRNTVPASRSEPPNWEESPFDRNLFRLLRKIGFGFNCLL